MISSFWTLLNVKQPEVEKFSLIEHQGPFEIRLYPRLVKAIVPVTGSREEGFKEGVSLLNDFLSGSNFRVERLTSFGPCFQRKVGADNEWEVGFVLPSFLSPDDVPTPINRHIRIEESLPVKVGTLRFKTPLDDVIVSRRAEELTKWMLMRGYRPVGEPRSVHHEFILPLPFLRNNEVQIDCYEGL